MSDETTDGQESSENAHFARYDKNFQDKVFHALLTDRDWAAQMIEVMKPDHFELKYLRYLANQYFKHYKEHRTFPSLALLASIVKDDLRDGNSQILQSMVVDYLHRMKFDPDLGDLPKVKEMSLAFCRKQAMKEALNKAVDLVETGKHEQVVSLMKDAVAVGIPHSVGHDFHEDFEARFQKLDRKTIPTGIPQLDKLMNGGAGRGELLCCVGATGTGKSHFLVNLGAHALLHGKNVVHYTLELSETNVGIRYDSNFCDIPSNEIQDNKELIKAKYENLELGRLIIKEYPTGFATVHTIRAHIEKLAMKSFAPHLIVIDYADIMRSTHQYDSLRHELKLVYEELRNLAHDFNVPVWTACFHGDTIISSPCGKFKIKDKIGQSGFPVFSYNHEKKKIVCKTVKSVYKSGVNKELWKVTLDNGNEVIVTPNHKFMLRDGSYAELKDLSVGTSLMPFNRRMKNDRKQIYLNNGSWEHQYRIVAEWKYGIIPKYYQIHHIDMNKFNDHPDNLQMLTISEHYHIHGRESWNPNNPCGLDRLRESYSERMKIKNPMFDTEVKLRAGNSRKGQCLGDNNPMKLEENKKKCSESVKSSKKFKEYAKKVPELMKDIWKNRSASLRKEIGAKIQIGHFGSSKEERVKQHQDIALTCLTKKEFLSKTKHIPLRGTVKTDIWKNKNHKIVAIEFWGFDDVYNMEVEDLHNYALDAGIVVKNSQSNRDGSNAEVVGLENMSEAYGKAMVCDVVVSISRKAVEKSTGAGRLFVAKNRAGRDGLLFDINIDTAKSKFTVINENQEMSLGAHIADHEQSVKDHLREKWNQIKSEK